MKAGGRWRSARSSPSPRATRSRLRDGEVSDGRLRKYKPTTPGRRGASVASFSTRSRGRPPRSRSSRRAGTRPDATCTRPGHRAAPGRRREAALPGVVDFRRNKDGVPAKVAHIEYDPNRVAPWIALLHYLDGEKRYILAPDGVVQGDSAMSGAEAEIGRATRCRFGTSRSAPRSTRSSSAGRRREDGAVGRHERPADGEGRHDGDAAAALGRDAAGAVGLQGDGRRGRQRRARADLAGQGRSRALEAQASVGPRRGDEPRRPPAGGGEGSPRAAGTPPRRGARRKAAPGRRTRRRTSTSSAAVGKVVARCPLR